MRHLYEGDRGTLVYYLQLALRRAGYPLELDGIFGPGTCAALKAFGGSSRCVADDEAWAKLLPYLGAQGEGPVVAAAVPYTSFLNSQTVAGLRERYPFLETGSIGRSVMGKEIPYLRIGVGGTEVFYSASYHANESITTQLLLTFAEEYLSAYAQGTLLYGVSAQELFSGYSLYMVPMVNPDGVDLVNGFLTGGLYYRQAEQIAAQYPDIPFPDGWKANIDGTDLNLQFPAGWDNARRIKFAQGYTTPAPRDYVGIAPLTAPESASVYRFTQAHDFSLILAYHTQGQVIYWRYLNYEPAGSREIAQYFSEVSGYAVEETPQESGYAGYKDWFIQDYNRPGYTIEAGIGQNPLPLSQFGQIYEDNRGILLGGMTQLTVEKNGNG